MDILTNENTDEIIEDYEAHIFQTNGQRKYGGPPQNWIGDPPQKGTEIFVGGLPREIKENSFVPLFAKIGRIYSTRLMMDFSGHNRGFAFIQYSTKAEAKEAIQQLHGYEMKPGIRLHVTKSVDNCRLFVGHIPKSLSKEQIESVLGLYFDDIKHVFIYYNPTDKRQNRGFCFVEFDDHRAACLARRKFFTSGIPEWPGIVIDWAIPEDDVDEEVMNTVTVMYMRNLMLKTSETSIREVLLKHVKSCEILRIRKVRDFAFVHFSNRNAASNAINIMNGFDLDGAEIFATWAKPAYAIEKVNKAGCKAPRKPFKTRCNTEGNNKIAGLSDSSFNYTKFDQESTGKIHCSTPVHSNNFSSSLSPKTYESAPSCSVVQNKSPNIVQCETRLRTYRMEALTMQKIILYFFTAFSPADALKGLYHHFGWGDVEYNVWPLSNLGSNRYIATIDIHYGQGMISKYFDLCRMPLKTPEEAKNVAAETFLTLYLWSQFLHR